MSRTGVCPAGRSQHTSAQERICLTLLTCLVLGQNGNELYLVSDPYCTYMYMCMDLAIQRIMSYTCTFIGICMSSWPHTKCISNAASPAVRVHVN